MFGAFVPNHQASGIGITCRQRWHDRPVGNPEPVDAMYAQVRVSHRQGVGTHATGSHRVIAWNGRHTAEACQSVALQLGTRTNLV